MFALTRKNNGLLNPWNDFFGDFGVLDRVGQALREVEDGNPVFRARTAVKEDENAYHITTELPGIDKKDVKVELNEGIMTITAEKGKPEIKKGEKEHFDEMTYGKYVNRLTLPDNVKGDKVEAVFKNGLLTVTVPKVEIVKPEPITIKVK
jgi:HSP20 family protein